MRSSTNRTGLGRRALLAGASAAALLWALPAAALSTGAATQLVQAISDELRAAINSGGSSAQVLGQIRNIFLRYADVNVIAASVLGPPWRSASNAQKQAYVSAFTDYLTSKYGRQFNEYRGASIDITGARDEGRKGVLVNTTVSIPGQTPFAVQWQASDRSGAPKVVNLFIEGVSMLSTERTEMQALLASQQGSLDGLINQLRARS